MEFKFSKHEVESRFYKILDYGDETEIAKRVDVGSSYISQMYNPDDPRESNLYKALKEIAAVMDVNQKRGCRMLRLFVELAQRGIKDDEPRCVQQETKRFNQELREYYDADMCNEPLEVQIDELADVERQAAELKKAKTDELKRKIERDVFQPTSVNGRG